MAIERSPVVGQCIAGWHGHVALIDPSAPVVSGDLTRVVIDYPSGNVASVIKYIETDSQNRWWISCDDGALQIGRFITPRCVQKVIGREPSPISLDHVPVMQPSAHTLEVGRRCLEALRADQAAHGRRVGVPFPAAELTHPKPFGRVPETMHATLPDSDLPVPSAPLNFTVQTIGNTAVLAWEPSAVHPPGTKYEIWSYPGSLSNVSSKVLAWQGDATQKTLIFAAASPFWYQARAAIGSAQTSAFAPNTFGVGVAPVIAQIYSSGNWDFSVTPPAMYAYGMGAALTSSFASAVITNSAGSAVFSWTNPGSADIAISYPGSSSTTFVASGLSQYESRVGTMWCNVNDSGNVSSKSCEVSFYSTG